MLYFAITILNLEFSVVVLFMAVIIRIIPIVNSLIGQIQAYNKTRGPVLFVETILSELDRNSNTNLEKNNYSKSSIKFESIELQKINFRYKDKTNFALNDISFSLQKSSIVALVGESGCGKTTLVDIISGYRRQDSGKLLINDCELEKSNLGYLSSMVSYAPQEPQIFDGSIFSHIAYGSDDASLESVIYASRLSGAFDFVNNLPEKFETTLIENGSNLSGGQKQKIDLARALMKNSNILILDEPTSGLDHYSEAEFNSIISALRKNTEKAIIIVTHKPSVAKIADEIFLLENGKIIDRGSHSKLLSQNQWYRDFSNN
jgi:ABC-type bacteriocin/lantibiotic exporter with double-glycine peptidase domain